MHHSTVTELDFVRISKPWILRKSPKPKLLSVTCMLPVELSVHQQSNFGGGPGDVMLSFFLDATHKLGSGGRITIMSSA